MTWKTVLATVGVGLIAACGSDPDSDRPAVDLPSEHGRWEVAGATRNGRPTNTLDAAYFEFDTTSKKISTNFTGEPLQLDYLLSDGKIRMRGSALLDSFVIIQASDSTMQLSTVIRGTPFLFDLVPARQTEEFMPGQQQEDSLDNSSL